MKNRTLPAFDDEVRFYSRVTNKTSGGPLPSQAFSVFPGLGRELKMYSISMCMCKAIWHKTQQIPMQHL